MNFVILVTVIMFIILALLIWLILSSRKRGESSGDKFMNRKLTIPTSFRSSNSGSRKQNFNPNYQRPM